ncbi:MAG: hypothetical protein QNJ74_02660 [Trichodesmium sp. MO_231.B1]|nr:hypothetical protein [Trichodesmium sp. MO_231.B1]
MFAGTTEAATLLGISTQRVRVLLKEGRILGAYKINCKTWVMPLFDGMPIISGKKHGRSTKLTQTYPKLYFELWS